MTKPQRSITWIISILAAHTLIVTLNPFIHSEFLVDQGYAQDMLFISLLASVTLILPVMHLHSTGQWRYYRQPDKHPLLIKLSLLLSPLFVWGMMYLYFSQTLPATYTMLFGQQTQVNEKLIKNDSHRRKSCDIRLDIERTITFSYCISKQAYSRLPNGEFEVTLIGKKTEAGILVEEVWYQNELRM
ncbi:hypothetical protein [Vibrio nomapromontoriensis]|uniref:hypothetical protein n=1 Tax=Vibrio nomapromontoriensis TaxID=2910246 RepID=UPI003D122836